MVPVALSLELEKVLTGTARGGTLPLAVRRFMRMSGSSRPEEAMSYATTRVLGSYAASLACDAGPGVASSGIAQDRSNVIPMPVSVERLCAVAGVDLVGAPRKQEKKVYRADYEPGFYAEHTATVEFTQPRPVIKLSANIGWNRGRIAAGHELGHVLIHKRDRQYDQATIRLGSTPAEEALAEYAARLLLLPRDVHKQSLQESKDDNYAVFCLRISQRAHVTIHAAAARLGDPDAENEEVRGAIFWRMVQNPAFSEVEDVLTPHWHLCPGTYIPLGKCKARKGSLVAELAADRAPVADRRVERVNIGTLIGAFRVDAVAWGSVKDRTRVVLSVFRSTN